MCSLQYEFWTHLTTAVPDLNVLNDLGVRILAVVKQTETLFAALSKINANHTPVLELYGEYLIQIRNHMQLGLQYRDRALQHSMNKHSIERQIKG